MQPVEGGKVTSLYQGTTNTQGVVDVSFTVPADLDPAQNLIVETQGWSRLSRTSFGLFRPGSPAKGAGWFSRCLVNRFS